MSQVPIDSPFGPASTTAEVIKGIDLSSKVAIVTGGYVGLGLETTKTLLSAGATVIVPVRTPEKAAKNLSGLAVETFPLDLLNPQSINDFADHFFAPSRPCQILNQSWHFCSSEISEDMKLNSQLIISDISK
jgi:hypothetical protein